MARKAKFKKGEQVIHQGRTMFVSEDQYQFRNKPVVDIESRSGLVGSKRVSVTELERPAASEPEPIRVTSDSGITTVSSLDEPVVIGYEATDNGINPHYIKTVDETLNERGNLYGDFTDHARIAQDLQDVMRHHTISIPGSNSSPYKPWNELTPVAKQALTVLADKIARILNGDPNYADNWHDIQGYAKLVEDRLQK